MGFALLVFAVVVSILTALGKTSGNFITIDSIECVQGMRLCPTKTCLLTQTRNNQNLVNVGCYLPYPMYNVTANVKMQRKMAGKYETLVSAKESLCEVVDHSIRSQFMARIFENVHQYMSNFECPFQGNVTAQNLPISVSFVPGFLPKSAYRIQVDIRNLEELILTVDVAITIGRKINKN